ncbi:MAG: FAD-dependent oxidoreductase [Thermodesulfobacteriota bacterium]|nr:FAD-dependent oxidoreductase [Thermodesulfobacteriota bacterium]
MVVIGGILVMGGLGMVVGLGLAIASKVFYVYVDPKIEAVDDALPGANCGGCGLPGCSSNAEAIVAGKASPASCVAGGPEIAAEIAGILGVKVEAREPEIASSGCTYGVQDAEIKYIYDGVLDCRAAALLNGGSKVCPIGCLGLGTCVRACPFGALSIGPDHLPVVDSSLCTGCGTCVRTCPKSIINLVSKTLNIIHLNLENECLAPCQQRCPAQVDIPRYIRLTGQGRYKEALNVIKERVPMPLSIGRVCPHFCESACRRNDVDEPVNINHLKRYCADLEMKSGTRYETLLAPSSEKRVAIVGGGPAGLAAAYYLKRLGHASTIFEAMPKLGGMLRYGIPEYRLPKKTLDWEIEGITGLGVEIRLNQSFGKDFSLGSLKEDGFDAVFLGMGAWGSRSMRVDGEDLKGVLSGTQYLIQRGLEQEVKIGKRVCIIGGGNTAIDAARTSLRLGAEEVTVLYRRSRKEMPAADYEVDEAEAEGVQFHFLAAPTRLIGENGNLTSLEYLVMELGEPDESGRRRPVPMEGSEKIIEVDNVIAAIGQFPELDKDALKYEDRDIEITPWNTIKTHPDTMQTAVDWVFSGGDVVNGAATVVEALAGGRKAAAAIHRYLNGETKVLPTEGLRSDIWDEATKEELQGVAKIPRNRMPDIHVPDRVGNFKEVELGFSEDQASSEASRCLQCGIYCFNRN